jgi:hypothetical protein
MKRSLAAGADPFTIHPLLSILPSRGSLARLDELRSALYARYEVVQRGLQARPTSSESQRKAVAEEAMLRIVLEWLQADEGASR